MRRWLIPVVALAVLTGLVAVWAFSQVGEHRDLESRASLRAQALTLASDQVRGLITVDPGNVSSRLKEMEKQMTGDFLTQFRGMYSTFSSVVTQGKVRSRGKVDSAGVERATSTRAVVLVAASSRVASTSSKGKPVERDYRFRVTLQRDSGHWLVSDMDFVG